MPWFTKTIGFLFLMTLGCATAPQTAKVEAPQPPKVTEPALQDKEVAASLEKGSGDMSLSMPEVVMLRAQMGLLPPPECVDTGWIRLNGDGDYPSSMTILMECEQPFEFGALFYPGDSVTVKPDSQGRFPLPYEGAYLVVKDGMPVIIYPHQGIQTEGELASSNREPRMFSIIKYRREGFLIPIVEE